LKFMEGVVMILSSLLLVISRAKVTRDESAGQSLVGLSGSNPVSIHWNCFLCGSVCRAFFMQTTPEYCGADDCPA
jgi:hypothetical protein